MKNYIYALIIIALILPISVFAQPVVVIVPDAFETGREGTLNDSIAAVIGRGALYNTIFKLNLYGLYPITGTITVPMGEHLTIIADDPGGDRNTAPPQILWTASGSPDTKFMFNSYGDVTFKNIWFMNATVAGNQKGSTFVVMQEDTLQNPETQPDPAKAIGENAVFEGCIFDYSPSPQNADGSIGIQCLHFRGKIINSYFRNCIDRHLRYYGRAVSFPYNNGDENGHHIDSLLFENCTFANIGYVYMQEGTEFGQHVAFNHCTFLNTAMFTLQTGWWNWLSVTNCIFVNPFMFGDVPSTRGVSRSGLSYPNGGSVNIDSIANFGFTLNPPPAGAETFTEADRHILFTHSSYYIEQWLVDYMASNPLSLPDSNMARPQPMMSTKTMVFFDSVVAPGQKLFPYVNRAYLYDVADPGFFLPPTNIDSIKAFLKGRWGSGANVNWAYDIASDLAQEWPMNESLTYAQGMSTTGTKLDTSGMLNFPLGDLYHWWPTQYTSWKAQEAMENQRINFWLTTGIDPGPQGVVNQSDIPMKFNLAQNFPNPFNPVTQIDFSIPTKGYVSLKVYNLIGQEVATLFSSVQPAGNYTATFDGSDLSSGVYFYRLKFENASITKKLVLMK
jgi:hypothetical protein